MAIAAHNSGGIVIVEVEKIVPKNTLRARNVLIHSSIVDYVLVAKPDLSLGEYNMPVYRPEVTGDKRIPLKKITIRPLDERKVCGRRSAMELKKDYVVNLGVGMPDSVQLNPVQLVAFLLVVSLLAERLIPILLFLQLSNSMLIMVVL